jgi:hypothetical protein
MDSKQIEQVLKLVTNNETAEKREAALRKAARLLKMHLRAARAMKDEAKRTETPDRFQRIANEIRANAAWRKQLAGDWSDEQDALQAIAKKFDGEYVSTGGGIYVVLIALGSHDCMGVSAECICRYHSAKAASAYEIFWEHDNDPSEGIVSLCGDEAAQGEAAQYAALLRSKLSEIRDSAMELQATLEFAHGGDVKENDVWKFAGEVVRHAEEIMANKRGELSLPE